MGTQRKKNTRAPRGAATRITAFFCAVCMTVTGLWISAPGASAEEAKTKTQTQQQQGGQTKLDLPAKSAILIEGTTGKVLYEQNADEKMPPASITKVMTLLLVMEALDSGKIKLTDKVTASKHACSMGGTQIWLEENEQMSVEDLLKATAVVSANDASVALGEFLAGSEETFVQQMNARAKELGMKNTVFHNATGLDADGHVSTARDIAIMSRELLKHKDITKYTTIWMDSLRDGKNSLVNTNKLIRFYQGATGLKTGTTDGAGACLSASATRNGMDLIAVTMGSANSDERFASARKLLDYGFGNYAVYTPPVDQTELLPVKVLRGVDTGVAVEAPTLQGVVIPKGKEKEITQTLTMVNDVQAPVEKGQVVGKIVVKMGDQQLGEYPVKAATAVEKLSFWVAFGRLLQALVCG